MKAAFAVMLAALTINARAADVHVCLLVGSVYESAASARDMRLPPEKALDMVSAYSDVPLAVRKRIINQVYFDSGFAYVGGFALRRQMTNLCLNGPKTWKPLK